MAAQPATLEELDAALARCADVRRSYFEVMGRTPRHVRRAYQKRAAKEWAEVGAAEADVRAERAALIAGGPPFAPMEAVHGL